MTFRDPHKLQANKWYFIESTQVPNLTHILYTLGDIIKGCAFHYWVLSPEISANRKYTSDTQSGQGSTEWFNDRIFRTLTPAQAECLLRLHNKEL